MLHRMQDRNAQTRGIREFIRKATTHVLLCVAALMIPTYGGVLRYKQDVINMTFLIGTIITGYIIVVVVLWLVIKVKTPKGPLPW